MHGQTWSATMIMLDFGPRPDRDNQLRVKDYPVMPKGDRQLLPWLIPAAIPRTAEWM
jgi:hypothetical protein